MHLWSWEMMTNMYNMENLPLLNLLEIPEISGLNKVVSIVETVNTYKACRDEGHSRTACIASAVTEEVVTELLTVAGEACVAASVVELGAAAPTVVGAAIGTAGLATGVTLIQEAPRLAKGVAHDVKTLISHIPEGYMIPENHPIETQLASITHTEDGKAIDIINTALIQREIQRYSQHFDAKIEALQSLDKTLQIHISRTDDFVKAHKEGAEPLDLRLNHSFSDYIQKTIEAGYMTKVPQSPPKYVEIPCANVSNRVSVQGVLGHITILVPIVTIPLGGGGGGGCSIL